MPRLPGVITGLDHLVLVCADIEAGIAAYSRLMGRAPDWRSADEATGTVTAQFRLANTALELLAPSGEGPAGTRLGELLDGKPARLTSLVFATDDIAGAHRTLTRRGLAPGQVSGASARHVGTGAVRRWQRFRLPDQACAGVKTFLLQHESPPGVPAMHDAMVGGLDHVVINTPNPDRALAHYGARLGLRLARDRTNPDWGARLVFFRTGALTVEILHRLDADEDPAGPDRIWGLSWAVDDLAAAHQRLGASGVDVSPIRTGRKPGTQVFTVKSSTLDIPTLFIAQGAR